MKLWVVGAGGIGSVLGGYLAGAGQDVLLVSRRSDHVQAINSKGLLITGAAGERLVRARATTPSGLHSLGERPDVVLLAVKSFDTVGAMNDVLPFLLPDSVVVSVQNGMNSELIASVVGRQRTICGVSQLGAALIGPGQVARTSEVCKHVIGELDGRPTSRIRGIAESMSKGILTEVTDNICGILWSKLAVNCLTNALTAVSGYAVDELFRDELGRKLAARLAVETILISEALSVRLEKLAYFDCASFRRKSLQDITLAEDSLRAYGDLFPGAKSSTLQDVEQGKKTEIDFLNGYVVQRGRELRIPAQANEAAVRMVKEVESGARRIRPGNIPDLWEKLEHNLG